MHSCQANKRATCGLPIVLGLCPKRKYHPLCGWIFIIWGGVKMNIKLMISLTLIVAAIYQGAQIKRLKRQTIEASMYIERKMRKGGNKK